MASSISPLAVACDRTCREFEQLDTLWHFPCIGTSFWWLPGALTALWTFWAIETAPVLVVVVGANSAW